MPLNILSRAYPRDLLPSNSIGWMVVGLALLVGPSSLGQADYPVTGIVTTKDGKPIAGVTVYGSVSKACCPFKREQATTDQSGQFRIEHPGAVIHFSKDRLKPKSIVIASEKAPIQIILEPSADSLIVPTCGKRDSAQKRIGWGKYGIRFNVAKHSVEILGGKPDVDYVTYLVKTKMSEEHLELWFGPNAMGELPHDDQFITSEKFAQRDVVNSDGGLLGMDSWGQDHSGKQWRQMAIVGQGGAIYSDITAERASIFDAIVNSACEVP